MPDQSDKPDYHFSTRAVRAGHRRTAEGEHSEPIFTTSSYVFGSAAEAAARFAGDEPGNIYITYRKPLLVGNEVSKKALKAIGDLLDGIVDDAIN